MQIEKRIVIRSRDGVQLLEYWGENGEREFYHLNPASRKFGVCLNKVQEPLRSILLKESGRTFPKPKPAEI